MNAVSSFHARTDAAIDAVKGRSLPSTANLASLAGIAWGLVAFGYGLAGGDAAWTWGALLAATFWVICLGQGGVMFSVIMHGTHGRWGRPLKRIGESFGVGLALVGLPLLIVFLVGGMSIYPWHDAWHGGTPVSLAPHGQGAAVSKPFWLSSPGFQVRQIALVVLLIGLDAVLITTSLKPDLIRAKVKLGSDAPAWWGRITGGSTDLDGAVSTLGWRGQVLVPIIALAYAVCMSLLAFDLIMSLDPWWFSNMFGGWIFMSSILLGLGGLAVVATTSREWLSLGDWIKPNVTHDLGKLMLAGTMFWAYTLFAQILPIYYTDVPEETNFLLVRMFLPQWSWLANLVALMCFLAPFTILLSRGIKKMRWPFLALALVSMTGLFLERTLLVMPSVHLGDSFPTTSFLFISLGIWAGVIGAFVQVVGRFLAQVPAVPVADPLLDTHPWDVHVHAAGHAHH